MGPSKFSDREVRVLEELTRRNELLAGMYLGALQALQNPSNPEAVVHCAHSLRELMEKLPRYLGGADPTDGPSVSERLANLEARWERFKRHSAAEGDDALQSHRTRSLLESVEEFFEWWRKWHPTRRVRTRAALVDLGLSRAGLPEPAHAQNVAEWDELHQYFTKVAHHKRTPDADVSARKIDLEDFLLDRWAPKTFDDFDAIDGLFGAAGA